MKALTLYQPHAYLIGCGAKPFETRSRKTSVRGLVAIHAAKIQTTELDGICLDPNESKPTYKSPFARYLPADWNDYFGNMNHGGIECLAVIKDCFTGPDVVAALTNQKNSTTDPEKQTMLDEALAFGDFSAGRFAYALTTRLHVAGNIGGVVRGHQGWWNLPEDLERELLEAYRKTTGEMICQVCGCTEDDACVTADGPCSWASEFLCSRCNF